MSAEGDPGRAPQQFWGALDVVGGVECAWSWGDVVEEVVDVVAGEEHVEAGDVMAAEEVVGDVAAEEVVGDVVEEVGDVLAGEEHAEAGDVMAAQEVVGDVVMGDVIVLEVAVEDREQEGEAVYVDVELVPLDNEEDGDREFKEDGQQGEAEGDWRVEDMDAVGDDEEGVEDEGDLAYVQTEEDPEQDEGQLEEGPGQGRQQWQPGEQEEEEDRPEDERKQEGPGPARVPMPAAAPLDALRTLQLELEVENKQAARAFRRLRLKICQRRKPQLEVRSTIIRSIPAFWAKAIQNHPHLSPLMGHWDKAILGFMSNLEVKESRHLGDCCKIVLFFDKNPYFYNEQIVKEYVVSVTRYRAYDSTPVLWKQHYEGKAHRLRHQNGGLNFFSWLSVHSFSGSGRIAEVISEELWPNPLPYYLRSKAAEDGSDGRSEVPPWKDHSRRKKPHPCDTAAKALASVSGHSTEPPHVDVGSGGSVTLAGAGYAAPGTRSRGSSVPLG